jgi:hypothetical protein
MSSDESQLLGNGCSITVHILFDRVETLTLKPLNKLCMIMYVVCSSSILIGWKELLY